MSMEPPSTYHQAYPPVAGASSTGGLATALTVLLSLCAVTSVASGLSSLRRAGTVEDVQAGFAVSDATLDAADVLVGVAVGVDALVTLATGVVFIVWFWRSIKNAQLLERTALDRLGSTFAPKSAPAAGWSIGSWLIPVANAVLPAYFLARVDRLSGPAHRGSDDQGARLLIVLWAIVWGAANVLSRVVWRSTPDDLSSLAAADRRDIWVALLFVAAAVLAILMVRAITSRQQRAFSAPALA